MKKKNKTLCPSQINWLDEELRLYVIYCLSKLKEIKCEECGSYEKLEFHHTKYAPKENVSIHDLKILCSKCHRNDRNGRSVLRTIFEGGKRFCEGAKFKFEYLFIIFTLLFSTPLNSMAAGSYQLAKVCQAAEIDPHKLANAIYKAEGGKKTRYPYGIKSVRCVGENDCRQVCLNTIRNNQKRFLKQNKYSDFIEFLGSRYCPLNIKGEYHLNKNWVRLVKYFYNHQSSKPGKTASAEADVGTSHLVGYYKQKGGGR